MRRTRLYDRCDGMTLLELLLAMFLTSLLLLGLIQLTSAASSAARLQDGQATLQDRARYAANLVSSAITEAGYSPEPWNTGLSRTAIAPGTAVETSANSDCLVLTTWSDRNCFDNLNPDRDADGMPLFYIRESLFDLSANGHLTRGCRYGPSPEKMITQVRRQGMVPGVESFEVRFGLDSNNDGNVDQWVRAGQWTTESQVVGVRANVRLAGPDGSLTERVAVTRAIRSRGG